MLLAEIILNVVLVALVLTVIVGSHVWAIATSRSGRQAIRPARAG